MLSNAAESFQSASRQASTAGSCDGDYHAPVATAAHVHIGYIFIGLLVKKIAFCTFPIDLLNNLALKAFQLTRQN